MIHGRHLSAREYICICTRPAELRYRTLVHMYEKWRNHYYCSTSKFKRLCIFDLAYILDHMYDMPDLEVIVLYKVYDFGLPLYSAVHICVVSCLPLSLCVATCYKRHPHHYCMYNSYHKTTASIFLLYILVYII